MPLPMKKALRLTGLVIAAGAVLAAVIVVLALARKPSASLEFSVRDAQSGAWVWDLTAHLQERYLKGYYQSDAGPIQFRFTKLAPGDSVLDLRAPSYEPVRLPVRLKPGANLLDAPILMRGLQIPGLDHFLSFENLKGSDLLVELRPVSRDGKAILNHPCLPLWVGITLSVEVKDGVPARDELETGVGRGKRLFSGPVEWRWDPAPETQFRYSAVIPGSAIAADAAPLRVADYLIVVPDPQKMSPPDLASLMEEIWPLPPAARAAALGARKDRLRAFTDTSWNVKGGSP